MSEGGPYCKYCHCCEAQACPGGCEWSVYDDYAKNYVCSGCEHLEFAKEKKEDPVAKAKAQYGDRWPTTCFQIREMMKAESEKAGGEVSLATVARRMAKKALPDFAYVLIAAARDEKSAAIAETWRSKQAST